MAETEFLQIRMTPESRQRLSRVAKADHLDESTWARCAILQELERWEAETMRGGRTIEEDFASKDRLRKVTEAESASATSELP